MSLRQERYRDYPCVLPEYTIDSGQARGIAWARHVASRHQLERLKTLDDTNFNLFRGCDAARLVYECVYGDQHPNREQIAALFGVSEHTAGEISLRFVDDFVFGALWENEKLANQH